MDETFTILITDPNLNVRQFLKREFTNAGYHALYAGNHLQLFARLYETPSPHVIVLDPDIPYIQGIDIMKRIAGMTPAIPVILHTYAQDYRNDPLIQMAQGVVEKNGDTQQLLQTVTDILKQYYAEGI
ncbi:MAG: response regulator [Thermodesulfobacteriota bacterium]|nr:response regulator [Thermodesulfobacteriota bacterium]